MSQKNTLESKRIRRLERSLRKGRVPRYLNLVHWLLDHREVQTKGAAKKLIEEKRVKHESHPLGLRTVGEGEEKEEIFDPFVPADLRNRIEVVSA